MSAPQNQYFSMSKPPVNIHERYHAHVYFNAATSDMARQLCDEAYDRFGLQVGRFHQKPVGPHPCWSCQISFDTEEFESFIPWLEKNRGALNILVHGLSGNDLKDHTEHAYWLGESAPLKLDIFRDIKDEGGS